MNLKLYDVTITSKKGRIYRFNVEAPNKRGAHYKAWLVKRYNHYSGKTKIVESLVPHADSLSMADVKPLSAELSPENRLVKINSVKID